MSLYPAVVAAAAGSVAAADACCIRKVQLISLISFQTFDNYEDGNFILHFYL